MSQDTTVGSSITFTIGGYGYWTDRGWVCPRCDRVNSPQQDHCPCSPGWHYVTPYPYQIDIYPSWPQDGTWSPTWTDGTWGTGG